MHNKLFGIVKEQKLLINDLITNHRNLEIKRKEKKKKKMFIQIQIDITMSTYIS